MSDTIIIAQSVTIVNNGSLENPRKEDITQKWADHKEMNLRVARKMMKIGYEGRGYRMAECATQLVYNYCPDCDQYTVARTNLCRDRFCPTCNWRLSLQRYINMSRITDKLADEYADAHYSFVTLTVRNCMPHELSDTMNRMYEAWDRLMHRKVMLDKDTGAAGWAKSIELTYNPVTHTIHPHYHVLVVWRKRNIPRWGITKAENDRYEEKVYQDHADQMLSAWVKSCEKSGLEAVIDAQNAQSIHRKNNAGESMAAAICETFKYAIKSKQLDEMPYKEFKILVDEIGGKRMVAFGGIIKEIAAQIKVNMETIDDEGTAVCRHCGSMDVDRLVYRWAFGEGRYIRD